MSGQQQHQLVTFHSRSTLTTGTSLLICLAWPSSSLSFPRFSVALIDRSWRDEKSAGLAGQLALRPSNADIVQYLSLSLFLLLPPTTNCAKAAPKTQRETSNSTTTTTKNTLFFEERRSKLAAISQGKHESRERPKTVSPSSQRTISPPRTTKQTKIPVAG